MINFFEKAREREFAEDLLGAFKLYTEGHEMAGDPKCSFSLARMYYEGDVPNSEGVIPNVFEKFDLDNSENEKKAEEICKKAEGDLVYFAEQLRSLSAINILADFYAKGMYFEKDLSKAAKYYMLAINTYYSPDAMFALGEMLAENEGIDIDCRLDSKSPMYWIRMAIDFGSVEAMIRAGSIYRHGLYGQNPDPVRSEAYYTMAAEKGSPYAMWFLASMYESGLFLDLDYDKAIYWYKKAVEAGYPRAQESLDFLLSKLKK